MLKGRTVLKLIRADPLCSANARNWLRGERTQEEPQFAKTQEVSERVLWITSCKLSKGLDTALSCCGLTSSGIEECSCCTSPNGPVGQTRPRNSHRGRSFPQTKARNLRSRKKAVVRPTFFSGRAARPLS